MSVCGYVPVRAVALGGQSLWSPGAWVTSGYNMASRSELPCTARTVWALNCQVMAAAHNLEFLFLTLHVPDLRLTWVHHHTQCIWHRDWTQSFLHSWGTSLVFLFIYLGRNWLDPHCSWNFPPQCQSMGKLFLKVGFFSPISPAPLKFVIYSLKGMSEKKWVTLWVKRK